MLQNLKHIIVVMQENHRVPRHHCVKPDLDHGWIGTHHEANFNEPNASLHHFRGDGFAQQNDLTDLTEQIENGKENPTEDQTMGFTPVGTVAPPANDCRPFARVSTTP